MWNGRWLLCLIIIAGLETRGAFSMNDSEESKESEATASSNPKSDGKKNPYDNDQVLSTNSAISSADDYVANLTVSNRTVSNVSAEIAASSSLLNTIKASSHGQSHSKRHIRRSKSYRKESKTKSRASLTNNNAMMGNLITSSTEDGGIEFHDFCRNATSEATPRTLNTTSRSIASNGSKDTLDERLERLSSRMSTSSSFSDNWDNSSSATSSDGAFVIDEESPSIELMAFTFDSGEGVHYSTLPNEIQEWRKNPNTSSPDAMAIIQTSDRSIEESDSTFASDTIIEPRIDRSQSMRTPSGNSDDDDISFCLQARAVVDPVHLANKVSTSKEKSSGNTTTDDSVLASVESESSASKNSNSADSNVSTGLEGTESNSMKKSNHSRSDADEYSWMSLDGSLNVVSPRQLSDALKRVESQESRGFYSSSNSTISHVSENTSEPFGTSSSQEEIDLPVKVIVPLDVEAIAKFRNVKAPPRSTISTIVSHRPHSMSGLSPRKRDADKIGAYETDESFRLTLSLDSSSSSCSSDSSENVRNEIHNTTNPFYQKRTRNVTLSVPGDKPERCNLPVPFLATGPLPDDHVSNSEEEALPEHSKNDSHDAKVNNTLRPLPSGRAQNLSYSDEEVLANLGPTVRESLIRREVSTTADADTTGQYTLAPDADLEENCSASSSLNVFTPSINFRKTISKVVPFEDGTLMVQADQSQNITTTEESLYIMEGFGFLKTNEDDISDLEDEIANRRRDVGFDYVEAENYPGYPLVDKDHDSGLDITDQIEFEGELPVIKQQPFTVESKENPDDRHEDPWWLNLDETNRKMERSQNNKGTEKEMGAHSSGFPVLQEIRTFQSPSKSILPETNLSDTSSYHVFLLPTLYIFIGMCIIVVGCSIWCSKVLVNRQQPNLKCEAI